MGKWMMMGTVLFVVAVLTGCGQTGAADRTQDQTSAVNAVLEDQMAAEDAKNAEAGSETEAVLVDNALDPADRQSGLTQDAPVPEETADAQALSSTEGIDVDLTALSSTVVYSEVYNMMLTPQAYVGKVVKMNGLYSGYLDEATGKQYYACIIQDATACCAQGIEFEPTDAFVYPDDFPEEGGNVTVVGTFETYEEGGYTYCTLRNAELLQD